MLHSGYAGSAHDSRVYNGSPLANATLTHFSNDEFLLADSAHAPCCIPTTIQYVQ
jgi:hypothetical protein